MIVGCQPYKQTYGPKLIAIGYNHFQYGSGENVILVEKTNRSEELESWLTQRGVDTSNWGTGDAKSVTNLWYELQEGDIALQDNPLLRVVHVVQVIIRRQDKILIEAMQEFDDGSRRFRNQPPSEKMKVGETYTDAALRCLREELGVGERDVTFDQSSYRQAQAKTDSPSYPGLPTHYTFHLIEAAVAGLPGTAFWHDNDNYDEGDPVKRHYWVWQPAEG